MSDGQEKTTPTKTLPWHAWKRRRVQAVTEAFLQTEGAVYFEIMAKRVGQPQYPLLTMRCSMNGILKYNAKPGDEIFDPTVGEFLIGFHFIPFSLPKK